MMKQTLLLLVSVSLISAIQIHINKSFITESLNYDKEVLQQIINEDFKNEGEEG